MAGDVKNNFPKIRIKVIEARRTANIDYDLLVNATPLGMKKSDPLPVSAGALRKGSRVYDLIYNPFKTRLVLAAQKRGLKAAGGLNMLLYQGAEAFKIWTGRRAPVETMRRALLRAIK